MHGRPRVKATGPPDPQRVKAAEKKAALFGQLAGEVLSRRAAARFDAESLALAGKLLELHPEVYTVWNYRREALGPVLDAGGEQAVAAVAGELTLTERALHKNPKSYATWHHRKWIVAKGFCSLKHELKLVGQLLDADERNFHGWGYRQFIVQRMGTPAERELEYTHHKINQNFSNYSAWHTRTKLLPVLHGASDADSDEAAEAAAAALAAALRLAATDGDPEAAGGPGIDAIEESGSSKPLGEQQQQQQQQQVQKQEQTAAEQPPAQPTPPPPAATPSAAGAAAGKRYGTGAAAAATAAVPKEALDEEYELVKQAFYTEPEDQSGWFYHRWLLGCSLAHWQQAAGTEAEAAEREALLAVLAREQQTCEELLEMEPDAKWPLLTLTRLKEVQLQVLASGSTEEIAAAEGSAAGGGSGLAAEVAEGYALLKEVDPLRRGYYEDAEQGRAHVVVQPSQVA